MGNEVALLFDSIFSPFNLSFGFELSIHDHTRGCFFFGADPSGRSPGGVCFLETYFDAADANVFIFSNFKSDQKWAVPRIDQVLENSVSSMNSRQCFLEKKANHTRKSAQSAESMQGKLARPDRLFKTAIDVAQILRRIRGHGENS